MPTPASNPLPPAVTALIAYARSQVGTREDPPNSNKTKYSPVARRWCADFVSHCYRAVDHRLPVIDQAGRDGFASCSAGLTWFRAHEWVVQDGAIRAGDILFFDWGKDGGADHVEIAISADAGWVTSIGGNTGHPRSDRVLEQQRHRSLVLAVVRVPTLWTGPDGVFRGYGDPCWKNNSCPV